MGLGKPAVWVASKGSANTTTVEIQASLQWHYHHMYSQCLGLVKPWPSDTGNQLIANNMNDAKRTYDKDTPHCTVYIATGDDG